MIKIPKYIPKRKARRKNLIDFFQVNIFKSTNFQLNIFKHTVILYAGRFHKIEWQPAYR